MVRAWVSSLMRKATVFASSYVRSEKGAMSPGRWQLWQLFCRMGATSL
jgi:hypothetical protein